MTSQPGQQTVATRIAQYFKKLRQPSNENRSVTRT